MRCTIDGREIHAALKVTPDFPVQVTEHTNEQTANFTDNRRTKLIGLTIEGVNSDLDDGAFAKGTDSSSMDKFFLDLQANPRPVPVVTPRWSFPAMNLEDYKPVAESKFKNAIHYTLTLKEDKTVALQKTTVALAQKSEQKRGPATNQAAAPPPRRTGAAALAGVNAAAVPGGGTAVIGVTTTGVPRPGGGVLR